MELHSQRVVDDLRRMAAKLMRGERADHTLTPTALVNEAVCRLLLSPPRQEITAGQMFGLAALVMRRVLIDHARYRKARPDRVDKQRLDDQQAGPSPDPSSQAQLAEVAQIVRDMAEVSPRAARALHLRYWQHLTIPESAEALGISQSLLKAEVRWAKEFLESRLSAMKTEDHGNDNRTGDSD